MSNFVLTLGNKQLIDTNHSLTASGMKEIQSTGEGANVKSVLLLTDGNPTDGITKPSDILKEISKLQDPPTGENTSLKVKICRAHRRVTQNK